MIPEVSVFPIFEDPDPCQAAGCAMQGEHAEVCRDHRCPHRWQREAAEDRAGSTISTQTKQAREA